MGANGSSIFVDQSITPVRSNPPTFEPNYGFTEERPRKVMKVTKDEIYSAKLPMKARNYCAHHYIIFNTCRRDNAPLFYRCAPERHALQTCYLEEDVDRFKEHEREKRLLMRAKRKAAKALRETLRETSE